MLESYSNSPNPYIKRLSGLLLVDSALDPVESNTLKVGF
jgi:hypothetical protein